MKAIIRTIVILLIFSSCNKSEELEITESTDVTIYNYAFAGTLVIGEHKRYLELGENWTIIIDEGLYTLDLISDENTHSQWDYKGLTTEVFIFNGHNEYFINNPVKEAIFYIPDE